MRSALPVVFSLMLVAGRLPPAAASDTSGPPGVGTTSTTLAADAVPGPAQQLQRGAHRPDAAPRARLEAPARGRHQHRPSPAAPDPDPLPALAPPEEGPHDDEDQALSGRSSDRDGACGGAL